MKIYNRTEVESNEYPSSKNLCTRSISTSGAGTILKVLEGHTSGAFVPEI